MFNSQMHFQVIAVLVVEVAIACWAGLCSLVHQIGNESIELVYYNIEGHNHAWRPPNHNNLVN